MSNVTLLGVLNMPPELWDGGEIDVMQRHSRYVEAAQRITELESINEAAKKRIYERAERINRLEAKVVEHRDGRLAALERAAELEAELARLRERTTLPKAPNHE